MSNGRKTIGDIKANIGISYKRIHDMRITTKEGIHGRLYLQVEVDEKLQPGSVLSLVGQKVEVTADDGIRLFAGICTSAGFGNTAGYRRVRIEAADSSVRMDKEPKDCIFQDPGKTLKAIADKIGENYGAEIKLDSDVPIAHIVSQNHETDWEFLKRIAAAEGKVLYTDIMEDGIRIFMGKTGLREFADTALGHGRTKSDEGSIIDVMQYESEELTMSAGDHAGIYTVREGDIHVDGGMLVNSVSCGYSDSIRPTVEKTSKPGLEGRVLWGTVTAVSINMVQVRFDADSGMGCPSWLAYESAMSSSLYSMPDKGDRIFVYYENNGKTVCLGSRRADTAHHAMQKPEKKAITNRGRMIKFTTAGVKMSAARELTME